MTVYRQWFCECRGPLRELVSDPHAEEDTLEPTCPQCEATPSSDPKHTVRFSDQEGYSD